MITHFDYWLGCIIDALKGADALEDTIIIHAADHGLALGNHGLMGKQNLYEHSIKVPLLVSGPGVPAGEVRETMVSSPDLFPTVCDLVEVPVPASVEGCSFATTLADGEAPHRDEVFAAARKSWNDPEDSFDSPGFAR